MVAYVNCSTVHAEDRAGSEAGKASQDWSCKAQDCIWDGDEACLIT